MSDQFAKLAEDEANAMVKLLEAPGRKVLVIVVTHDKEQGIASIVRGVSKGTVGADARAFIQAVDRERDRLASKLIRRAS